MVPKDKTASKMLCPADWPEELNFLDYFKLRFCPPRLHVLSMSPMEDRCGWIVQLQVIDNIGPDSSIGCSLVWSMANDMKPGNTTLDPVEFEWTDDEPFWVLKYWVDCHLDGKHLREEDAPPANKKPKE